MFRIKQDVLTQNDTGLTKHWLRPWEVHPFRLWSALEIMKVYEPHKGAIASPMCP